MDETVPPKGVLYAFFALCFVVLLVTFILVATYV
jgi:hypothetical protein